jgi:capsule polysaccharide export protein KpsE/RkpR
VTALTDPALLKQGATAIEAALRQVQTDFQAVKSASTENYQPQIEALQASLKDLQRATGQLGQGSPGPTLTELGTAITGVGTDASALLTDLTTTCA